MSVSEEELSRDGAGQLTAELAEAIRVRVRRRVEREPMAYILGRAGFREIEVALTPGYLSPGARPSFWSRLPVSCRRAPACTRSGRLRCRGPAVLSERPDLRVSASDLSPEAADAPRKRRAAWA